MKRLLLTLALCTSFVSGASALTTATCMLRNDSFAVAPILCVEEDLRAVDAKVFAYFQGLEMPDYKKPRAREIINEWLGLRETCRDADCLRAFYMQTVPQLYKFLDALQKEVSA